ncbi:hypothetical protein ISCU110981_20100 [Isoptericola cucumis]
MRGPAALQRDREDGVPAEQSLDPAQRPAGPVVLAGVGPPQPGLERPGGRHLLGGERQVRDRRDDGDGAPGARPTGASPPGRRRREPALELPPHPVGDAGGAHPAGRSVRAPDPLELLVLGASGDAQPAAGQASRGQQPVQPLREAAGRERGDVDAQRGRVQLLGDDELRLDPSPGGRAHVLARGQAVRPEAEVPEPRAHLGRGQRRQVAQGLQPQPPPQARGLPHGGDPGRVGDRVHQVPHRAAGQERAGLAGGDDGVLARREHRREQPVGHADLALVAGVLRHGARELAGERPLRAVVAGRAVGRQQQQPRARHLEARHDRLGRRGDRLELPGVAGVVDVEEGELGAALLRLPAAHAPAHPLGTGDGGHRHHAVPRRRPPARACAQHRGRDVRVQARDGERRDHGPVRHPEHGGAHQATRSRGRPPGGRGPSASGAPSAPRVSRAVRGPVS